MTVSTGRYWLLFATAIALLAGACTTVPTNSAPTVIRPVAVTPQPVVCTQQGNAPRNVVSAFLNCNGKNDPNHNGARQFLTSEERPHWSDSSVTIIDFATPSNFSHHHIVRQRARDRHDR